MSTAQPIGSSRHSQNAHETLPPGRLRRLAPRFERCRETVTDGIRDRDNSVTARGTIVHSTPAIEQGVRFDRLTTVGIGGPALAFAQPGTLEQLRSALAWARDRGLAV